jgi:hypothetical protein
MTTEHPITPPPELVEQWRTAPEYTTGKKMFTMVSVSTRRLQEVATQAARWGADQELSECCKWLPKLPPWSADDLRKHRRPKPPSLKELNLKHLEVMERDGHYLPEIIADLRRALESLPD